MANNQLIDKALAYVGNNMQTKSALHNMFTVQTYALSFSISNGYGTCSVSVAKTGYTPLGIVGWVLNTTWYFASAVRITDTTASLTIRKSSDASASETIGGYVYVLYVKNT